MAEYTALVEAGESFAALLRKELTPEPISDTEAIALASPFETGNSQLSIYLFHIDEELQGGFSGYHNESLHLQRMQPSTFQLSYLLTANSKAPAQMKEADQQRIIGKVIQTIKDYPSIPEEFLQGSLKDNKEELKLNLERPNFEQMLKIWNNTSVPYRLSVVCKLTGVSITSRRTKRTSRVSDIEINTKILMERK